MDTHHYSPVVLFEETNIVGNAYFSNYVRWHQDAVKLWLCSHDQSFCENAYLGRSRIYTAHSMLRFPDPCGAILGDELKVNISVEASGPDSYLALTEICRAQHERQSPVAVGRS